MGSDRRRRRLRVLRPVPVNAIFGAEPTTAGKVLAMMYDTEHEFLNDLFGTNLRFVTTRPCWKGQQD